MIVLDVEASGLNYEKHSILSIGALDFDNPDNRFYGECQAWEGAHMSDEALEVNGFSEAEATDDTKQTEAQLLAQFITWAEGIEDQTFVGQNVSFDRDFIKAACERAGYNYPFAHRTLDTHTMAYMHHVLHHIEIPIVKRHSGLNIEAVTTYVGIPEEPKPHNALTGALIHAEFTSRLMYGKKLLPEFEQFDIPSYE
jgi:DNA polymerase III epsilon subunit-like protein